jgi:hypothetical protein
MSRVWRRMRSSVRYSNRNGCGWVVSNSGSGICSAGRRSAVGRRRGRNRRSRSVGGGMSVVMVGVIVVVVGVAVVAVGRSVIGIAQVLRLLAENDAVVRMHERPLRLRVVPHEVRVVNRLRVCMCVRVWMSMRGRSRVLRPCVGCGCGGCVCGGVRREVV